MNKRIYIILILLVGITLILQSCRSNTILKKPENLIPKDQMVDLLTDMYLASGAENVKNLNLQRKINYYTIVFEKYQIDSTQFKESNYYYTSRIDDYDEILEKVQVRIDNLSDKYETERRVTDSIKRFERDSIRTLNKAPKINQEK